MTSVNITINGVICDLHGRTITGPVKIVGEAMYSDLGVGGGPVIPGAPPSDAHPEHPIYNPPGIWGPTDPRPTPPIYLPPVLPGGPPVQIWPSPGRPAHPIVLPPPPTDGISPGGGKPPPPDGGWGYHPDYGWGYFPAPGEPGPKA